MRGMHSTLAGRSADLAVPRVHLIAAAERLR
jgi:hypothetical protein